MAVANPGAGAREPYKILLQLLATRKLSAIEFQTIFLPLYKNDPKIWDEESFSLLESVFADVDALTDMQDADILGETLSEEQFVLRGAEHLSHMLQLDSRLT